MAMYNLITLWESRRGVQLREALRTHSAVCGWVVFFGWRARS